MISAGLQSLAVSILQSRGYLREPTTCPQKIAAALTALQRRAGLDVTGELDRETLAELDAPRFCALPDVMEQRGGTCRWPDGNIGYFVQDALPGLSIEQTWDSFDWAMKLWAGAGNLRTFRARQAAEARIVAKVKRLDGPNGVLAQSQLPCGSIRQAMQDYDSGEAWNRTVDARLVIAHELGHALGLDHAPGKGSLMSAYYDPLIKALQTWDVNEIVRRYGAAVPQTPPTPPTPPAPAAKQLTIDYGAGIVYAPVGWRIEVR